MLQNSVLTKQIFLQNYCELYKLVLSLALAYFNQQSCSVSASKDTNCTERPLVISSI